MLPLCQYAMSLVDFTGGNRERYYEKANNRSGYGCRDPTGIVYYYKNNNNTNNQNVWCGVGTADVNVSPLPPSSFRPSFDFILEKSISLCPEI